MNDSTGAAPAAYTLGQVVDAISIKYLGPLFLNDDDSPDAPYPAAITIYCDRCHDEDTRDYVVTERMTKPQRFEAARRHLRTDCGWSCSEKGDFCPDCAPEATP